MRIVSADDVERLRGLCERQRAQTRVHRVADARPDWDWVDGWLCHARSDYFRIGAHRDANDDVLFLIAQREPALVMLVLARIDGEEAALLSLRAEPGLIGGVNLTTTIQSTPSNFRREHGGRPTPFIDIAFDPSAHGTVVHDGFQYDWGSWYLRKRKRFLVVRLDEAVEAPEGFVWVRRRALMDALREDHLVTNDLRVAAILPPSGDATGAPCDEEPSAWRAALTLVGAPEEDCRGARIGYFRTETTTREVGSWAQPLLVPAHPMQIVLCRRKAGDRVLYALGQRSQAGLQGVEVWFPADVSGGNVVNEARVSTSAEGGRFWQHRIDLVLRDFGADGQDAPTVETGEWMDSGQVEDLMATSCRTSLELRMAWSLAVQGHAQAVP